MRIAVPNASHTFTTQLIAPYDASSIRRMGYLVDDHMHVNFDPLNLASVCITTKSLLQFAAAAIANVTLVQFLSSLPLTRYGAHRIVNASNPGATH